MHAKALIDFMPKFLCECGQTLLYSDIPCEIEYKFISDVDYDKFHGKIDSEELYEQIKSFIKCKNCNRLWVFWQGFNNSPTEYVENL